MKKTKNTCSFWHYSSLLFLLLLRKQTFQVMTKAKYYLKPVLEIHLDILEFPLTSVILKTFRHYF